MNKQEKNETAILNKETMGGIKLPFFDSRKSFFAPSNLNTNSTFAPSYGVISQQLHQPSYLHYLSESPKKYSQISQSGSPQAVCHLPKPEKVIEPTSRLFEKMQATSSIPFVDSCHHQRAGSVELIHSKHPNLQSLLSSTSLVDNWNLDWKQVHEAEGILPRETHGDHSQVRNECSTPWIGTTVAHAPMKSAVAAASKQQIRWSRELHGQFVEAVNSLGGASKATPKEILKLMKSEALTISHIKSHLQKYRTSKHTPNFIGGKNKRSNHDGILQFNMQENGRLHILEALHLQKDVQKSLEEHLEHQRNQEIRIEEHAKLLRWKFDHKKSYNFSKNHNLDYSKDASSFIKQSTAGKGDNSENYLDKTDA